MHGSLTNIPQPGFKPAHQDHIPSVRIIETIDGVHRFEDDDSDPVEWLQAHDTGEPERLGSGVEAASLLGAV